MIFCRELTVLSEDEWINKLQISSEEFNQLVFDNVFSVSKKRSEYHKYRINFVGEIVTKRSYIISFPKCIESNEETLENVKLVRAALDHYYNSPSDSRSVHEQVYEEILFRDKIEEHASNEIEVYLTLREYFKRKKVYKPSKVLLSKSQNKRIDWKRTIEKSNAYIDEYSVFYLEPYMKSISKSENLVSDIYKCILGYLSRKYETDSIKYQILSECQTFLKIENIRKNAISYCSRIRKELFNTFNTQDVLILQILHDYIKELEAPTFQGISQVKLYGTNYFHVIWEHICSYLFRNQYSQLKGNFAQPKWFINNTIIQKGEFRPDVILRVNNRVVILDAKYYYPIPEKVCGVSDIAKQLLYAQIADQENIENIFIFPGRGDKALEYMGYVGIFDSNDFEVESFKNQRIMVFKMSLEVAINALFSNKDQELILSRINSYVTQEIGSLV